MKAPGMDKAAGGELPEDVGPAGGTEHKLKMIPSSWFKGTLGLAV